MNEEVEGMKSVWTKRFLSKTVYIRLKNGYKYEGKIISMVKETVLFEDIKVGECIITVDDIISIIPKGGVKE